MTAEDAGMRHAQGQEPACFYPRTALHTFTHTYLSHFHLRAALLGNTHLLWLDLLDLLVFALPVESSHH
jgi:hypothetical protein